MASFEINSEICNSTEQDDKKHKTPIEKEEIEHGILKQLFYKVGYGKIPQSRYRKLHKISALWTWVKLVFITLLAIPFVYAFKTEFLTEIKESVVSAGESLNLSEVWAIGIFIMLTAAVLGIISYAYKSLLSRYTIRKVSLPSDTVVEGGEGDESVFSKYLDEIFYFFEVTRYQYVFFEDLALMFAVADWMKMKSSESDRKAKYEKSITHVPIKEILAKSEENKQIQKEIASWEKKVVTVGKDIPVNGTQENYEEYPYIVAVVEMLSAWKNKNYGKLSSYLQKMFSGTLSEKKRAGECRKFFESKLFNTFELVEVEERACALSKVVVKIFWTVAEEKKEAVLTFGCVYQGNDGRIGLPWRNDGKWILNPWDIQGLYQ